MGVEDGRKTSGASAFGRRTDKRLVKQVKYILLSTLIKILGFYIKFFEEKNSIWLFELSDGSSKSCAIQLGYNGFKHGWMQVDGSAKVFSGIPWVGH